MPPCTWVLRLAHRSAAGAGEGRRHRGGVGELVAARGRRHGPRPTRRWSPARWPRACWRSGASPPGTWRSAGRTAPAPWRTRRPGRCTRGRCRRPRRTGSTRARSTSVRRAPGSTVGRGAVERDAGRCGGSGRGWPGSRRSPRRRPRPPRRRRPTPTSRTSARPAAEHDARRRRARRRRRTSTAPPSATAPAVDPSASPGRSRALVASSPAAARTALAIAGGHERARGDGPAELLDHDDQLRAARSPSRRAPRGGAGPASRGRPGRSQKAGSPSVGASEQRAGRARGRRAWRGSPTRSRPARGGLR